MILCSVQSDAFANILHCSDWRIITHRSYDIYLVAMHFEKRSYRDR